MRRGLGTITPLGMLLLLAGVIGMAGCSDSGSEISAPIVVNRDFDWVQVELLNRSCVLSCHDSLIHQGGLDLSSPNSYEGLIDVSASYDPGVNLVEPGSSATSGLILVFDGQSNWPEMPPGGMTKFTSSEIEIIKAWIDRGAPRHEN